MEQPVDGAARAASGEEVSSDTRHELWKEDLICALLGGTLVLGLFLDGWNHINLQNGALGSFFTPWHGLLYLGFTATAIWVMTRNPHLYRRGLAPKPEFQRVLWLRLRYPFAMVGIALASVGVVGDLIWHTILGAETGVARVIAPFHLFLFLGGGLLLAAPLRSAWHAPRHYPAVLSLHDILPPLISLTMLTALAAFMFQWLSAFVEWSPSLRLGDLPAGVGSFPPIVGSVQAESVAQIVITNLVLMAPVLLALRRWRLPAGSVTIMFTVVAVMMCALTNFSMGWAIAAAFVGGVVADALIARFRPEPDRPIAYRIVAGVPPLAMWFTYFLLQVSVGGISWPFDLWFGAAGLAAFTSLLISFLVVPPSVPVGAWAQPTNEA
jgi:hypothetical protein